MKIGELELTPVLICWCTFVPLLHITLVSVFRLLDFLPQLSRKGCRSSDIVALEIVSSVCVVWVAVAGTLGFFNFFEVVDNLDIYTTGKFYSRSIFVEENLVIPMLSYQLWNLVACILHNEYRDVATIGHHVVTAGLAYCGFAPYAQYYALFYFGVAEVTTIPLNIMTIFKHVPQLSANYPNVYTNSRNVFVVGYFIVRIFWWPVVSYELFFGCMDLLNNNLAHSNIVVWYFLFANLFLTGLQFFWAYLIVRKALTPDKEDANGVASKSSNCSSSSSKSATKKHI